MLKVGLDLLIENKNMTFAGKRLGYLSNQASTSRELIQGRILLAEKYGAQLTCLFSPQHGFYSEKQDNMVESDHMVDDVTGLPVYSLYGKQRRPTPNMFAELDVLIIDLVDVGTRVYTFLYTMAYCLELAAELGKKIVVLDRPNPIGGEKIEGNLLQLEYSSFVGLYPIPMRHGLTFGELALYINQEFKIEAELEIIPLKGWNRSMFFRDTGYPWVSPSPNMPTPETALVYPGQVIWEGTNVSEGRGTTLPFECFGAPFWNHKSILKELAKIELPGCLLRPLYFEPTSGKWANQRCCGFQLHVTDAKIFLPYRTSIALLQKVLLLYPHTFKYKEPPYEYEMNLLPMDLILGSRELRKKLEEGVPLLTLEKEWQEELHHFDQIRKKYFLYY